jgi:hypothetical protein
MNDMVSIRNMRPLSSPPFPETGGTMDAALTVGDFFFGGNWASLTVANLYHRGAEDTGEPCMFLRLGTSEVSGNSPKELAWSYGSGPGARVIGGPAIAPDGQKIILGPIVAKPRARRQ